MEESTEVQCPICNMSFRDKRGLTSHARYKHDLEKEDVVKMITQKEKELKAWRVLGGVFAIFLALIRIR